MELGEELVATPPQQQQQCARPTSAIWCSAMSQARQSLALSSAVVFACLLLPEAGAQPTAMAQTPAAEQQLGRAINSFGDALLSKVTAQGAAAAPAGTGVFLSPYGLAEALGMLLYAAEPGSASAQQLERVVFGGGASCGAAAGSSCGDAAALGASLSALRGALTAGSDGSNGLTVSDASSSWLAPRYALQPQYSATLESAFGAEARTITDAAAVNSWVADATKGKIDSIVDDGTVAQATLLLVNAVYFKGLWASQFQTSRTQPMAFSHLDGSQSSVAAMHQAYANRTALQVAQFSAPTPGGGSAECIGVKLPYQGSALFTATLAMPVGALQAGAPLALEGGLPYAEALAACQAAVLGGGAEGNAAAVAWGSPSATVQLYLPRFEAEYEVPRLTQQLQALGITAPFAPGDLTRAAADAGGRPVADPAVSDVLQKVYVKVDEEGTEAAAATAVVMTRAAFGPSSELEVRFDRPFFFAVVHEPSGLALFAGQVHRPEAGEA